LSVSLCFSQNISFNNYIWWSILTFGLGLEFHYSVKNFIPALNSPLDLRNVTVFCTYTISARQRTAYRVTRHTQCLTRVCLCVRLRSLTEADMGALISRESFPRHSRRHLGYIRLVLVHRPCTYVGVYWLWRILLSTSKVISLLAGPPPMSKVHYVRNGMVDRIICVPWD